MVIRSIWSFGQYGHSVNPITRRNFPISFLLTMGYQKSAKIVLSETRINKALYILKKAEFTSIYAAAKTYNFTNITLRRRFN